MDWKQIRAILGRSGKKYHFYFGDYGYTDPVKSDLGRKIPKPHLGWGRRAVDIRANKTNFDRFENDTLGFNDLMSKYNIKEAFDQLKDDVLICGVGFLAFASDKVVPFTAEEATGIYDWDTQNLKSGVAVYRESTKQLDRAARPDKYIVYNEKNTQVGDIENGEARDRIYTNPAGRPLIGLLTHKATTKQPFGHSVLDLTAREAILDASRTIRQANVASYYYNIKLDVILGADAKTSVDKINTQVGDILKVGTNENGQIPQLGEFAQHAMAPFTDTVMIAARNFCADTKLSLANLGIDTNAPQSTEALEIVSDDLKDDILAWQKELGQQLKYFLFTLYLYEQKINTVDDNLRAKYEKITPAWSPIFEADVSKFGDGLTKIAQQAPEIVKTRSIWKSLGLTSEEIDSIINSASTSS